MILRILIIHLNCFLRFGFRIGIVLLLLFLIGILTQSKLTIALQLQKRSLLVFLLVNNQKNFGNKKWIRNGIPKNILQRQINIWFKNYIKFKNNINNKSMNFGNTKFYNTNFNNFNKNNNINSNKTKSNNNNIIINYQSIKHLII